MAWNICHGLPNAIKYKINTQNFAQDFNKFTKVVKFRQIWSHWPSSIPGDGKSFSVKKKQGIELSERSTAKRW